MAANDPHTRDWIKVKHAETGGETEISPRALESYRRRGWQPLTETTPDARATVAQMREWAIEVDPDNADAIAAMTKTEIRRQYGADNK